MASPYRLQSSHFNSRPHGGRPTLRSLLHSAPAFQLTPSRRATVSAPGTGLSYVNFNSRPHGGRRSSARLFPSGLIFQLTPSRRATKIRKANFNDILISTHALTEGDKLQRLTNFYHFHFNSRPHGGRLVITPSRISIMPFQLTPSRRATISDIFKRQLQRISTHALTEGDGKFRQIFLLNRGYACSISLYFLPHFISLLPQILSFQQKSFKFQVRIFLLFSVHLAFALQNQCVHHVKYRFCTNMFYFVFVLFTQIVKPQTIGLFIYDFF